MSVIESSLKGDVFFKIPELLPKFKSENEDPEAFVDDFNVMLKCIEEAPVMKTVLWFKIQVRIPSSNWDAALSLEKESLHAYWGAFLKHF